MSIKILLVISVVVALLLLFALSRTQWFQCVKTRWSMLRIALDLCKMRRSFDSLNSPRSKLKRARKAIEVLRAGFWVNLAGEKIYLNLSEYSGIPGRLQEIKEAMEAGFSYRRIGTTKEEIIGFRNGDAHEISAQLQLVLSRRLEQKPLCDYIIELAKDAEFTLEAIGTSQEELEWLSKEYLRQMYERYVDRFRQYARGISSSGKGPDEFKEQLTRLLSPDDYGFSYEDLGTSEEECIELIRLAWRREVIRWIDYLKKTAHNINTDNLFARKMIEKSLEKAGLVLRDFNMSESDLDKLEWCV